MVDGLEGTELIVVRHGETVWNREGRQQGWLDTDLTELGVAQTQAVAEGLAEAGIAAVYSSDLGRAVKSAQIIAEKLGLAVVTEERLRERNLGIVQGMTLAEFAEEKPDEYARFSSCDADYVVPEGESRRQISERVVASVNDIAGRHEGKRVLLVAHGGVLNSMFRYAVGLEPAGERGFLLYNSSINMFVVRNGKWQLARWGDTHHLRGMETRDDS